ncbi:MAG: bacterioferritin-associated ferredoxin [Gammaproteobacteria bacterium]|jgi:bacterioferritin-associated ferredoxin|nr:bacterioferritin-associated ferredoxin [Gammaproteobacteria bacterium]
MFEAMDHNWTGLTIIRIRVYNAAMIVCVCKAVSDRHIRAAVKDGATCMGDLRRELSVGACCGKCVPEAKAALAASLAQRNEKAATPFFPVSATEFAV